MKKLMAVLLSIFLLIDPVFGLNEEHDNYQAKSYEFMVKEMVGSFYVSSDSGTDMYYGEETEPDNQRYYQDTVVWYMNGEYERILQYNVLHEVSVVKDLSEPSLILGIATRSFTKSTQRTYSIDQGGTFQYGTVTVKFTGQYTYDTGDEEVTSLTASSSVTKPSNFSVNNRSLSKSFSGATISLTETMNIVVTLSAGTTISFSNQRFHVSFSAN